MDKTKRESRPISQKNIVIKFFYQNISGKIFKKCNSKIAYHDQMGFIS